MQINSIDVYNDMQASFDMIFSGKTNIQQLYNYEYNIY